MAITTSLKRAPKWAWWTVGGLAVGGIGIRLWQDRAKPADETQAGEVVGGVPVMGGGAPGVIVPPVIIPPSDDGSSNLVPLMDLFTSAIQSVTGGWQDVLGGALGVDEAYGQVYNPVLSLIPGLVQNIESLASAGGPPDAGQTPVIVNVPMPAPPSAQPAPAPGPTGPAPCPPGFPNRGPRGCYANCGHDECRSGRKVRDHGHCYPGGARVHVSFEDLGGKC